MIANRKWVFAAAFGLIGAVSPAVAHHSFAMFDQTKTQQANGATVRQFHWTNPHSFVVVDIKGTNYTLECNSTNMMSRAGWKANTVKPGDKVDVVFYPLRTGKPGGMLKTVGLPGGATLKAW